MEVLIKSVLPSITSYVMSVFMLSGTLINDRGSDKFPILKSTFAHSQIIEYVSMIYERASTLFNSWVNAQLIRTPVPNQTHHTKTLVWHKPSVGCYKL